MMLPALRLASREEINSKTVAKAVAEEFGLTDDDLTKLNSPRSSLTKVRNNAQFAIVHLRSAGLIALVRPEAYAITERGRDFLAKNPSKISVSDLREFKESRKGTPRTRTDEIKDAEKDGKLEGAPSKSDALPEGAGPDEPETRQSLQVQAEIAQIGAKMGFKIWIPPADRAKVLNIVQPAQKASFLVELPLNYDDDTLDTIRQIDVLWLKGRAMARAFEVEHTTAIYSGILRMADLLALQPKIQIDLHIVAPLERREKVFRELKRPVFSLLLLDDKRSFLSYESISAIGKEKFLSHMTDSILNEYKEYAIKDKNIV